MLVNDDPSQIIPKSNWKVHGLKVEWTVEETRRIEESIRITEGALTPCPSGVKIYGLGDVVKYQGRYLGTYKLTPTMWNGHPVYKSNDGNLLFMGTFAQWIVNDDDFEEWKILGLPGTLCPTETTKWEYWNSDDEKRQSADIIVKSI